MKTLAFLLLCGLVLVAGSPCLVAGSVTFAELEGVLKSNPKLYDSVEAIDFEENGTGARLGRHFRGAHGGRVGPYVFKGRGRSSTGPYDVEVKLVTDWHLEDRQGNVYKGDPPTPPDDDRPLHIREKLVSVEISDFRSATEPESAGTGGDDGTKTESGMARQEGAGTIPPMPPTPSPGGGAGLAGTFTQGDYLYAGEYYCDNFMIRLKAGQVLEVTLHSEGVTPEILSRKDQWFGSAGPRNAPGTAGAPASIRYEAVGDGALIVMVTNKNKLTEGSYRLGVSIDGKVLVFPDPLPTGQTDKKIVPLN